MTIEIIQNGLRYATVKPDGQIVRLDGANGPGSDSWRVAGAVRLNNFGHVVERFTLAEVMAGGIQWQHKNGAQRVYLLDTDHGAWRMWESPSHRVINYLAACP